MFTVMYCSVVCTVGSATVYINKCLPMIKTQSAELRSVVTQHLPSVGVTPTCGRLCRLCVTVSGVTRPLPDSVWPTKASEQTGEGARGLSLLWDFPQSIEATTAIWLLWSVDSDWMIWVCPGTLHQYSLQVLDLCLKICVLFKGHNMVSSNSPFTTVPILLPFYLNILFVYCGTLTVVAISYCMCFILYLSFDMFCIVLWTVFWMSGIKK